MGIIQICESGSTTACYVEKSGELLSSASSAFSSVVPFLFGALVLVVGLTLGKWIVKKVKP